MNTTELINIFIDTYDIKDYNGSKDDEPFLNLIFKFRLIHSQNLCSILKSGLNDDDINFETFKLSIQDLIKKLNSEIEIFDLYILKFEDEELKKKYDEEIKKITTFFLESKETNLKKKQTILNTTN